jgi:hypothetical protein
MIIDLSFDEKNYEPKGDVEEKQIKSNAKDKFSQKLIKKS